MVGWGSNSNLDRLRGVDRGSLIGDISNIAIVVVRGVLDSLDTAIRESNRVRSLYISCSISSLSGIEVGVGVVISNSVLVGVGLLSLISRGSMGNSNRCSMSNSNWGSMCNSNRGRVGNSNRSSMSDKRGGMGHSNRGGMSDKRGGMGHSKRGMSHNSRSSMSKHWGTMDSMGSMGDKG